MESLEYQEIYITYFNDVYKYTFSLCKNKDIAEEVTQETFFKALRNIDDFNGSCKLFSWLCQIAKNTLYNYLKKQKKFVQIDEEIISKDLSLDIERDYLNKEQARNLHQILHNLKEPYKEVFFLRVFAELSFKQIGEIFNKTDSWARVVYYRAKNKIQEEIK
ncbi:RNA polymerase sigma factor [Streptococcus suis]|uniref:RNA polymerase sigma factor n=1 Tax=Streptococcus suis TaxID=1307 RepID=A0AB33U8L0_STRSU|nr:sigma-70 family RNA polymerase sigma factor [Streptococcus suis]NQS30872.1 sigma-70 family RNA polymerase sigma factor [Streptococcus suis]CYX42142.1 RNA polymerase sigma factor [Streptococcus suis]